MILLAGDIGATNSRLALYEARSKGLVPLEKEVFPSQQAPSLVDIVARFLKFTGRQVDFACFGVPGPVLNGRSATTNLPWFVDAGEIQDAFKLNHAWVLNDLEAMAYGVPALTPSELLPLTDFNFVPGGNAVLIAPGSGPGEAILYWDGDRYHPYASEGGHATFAPSDELQVELWRYLANMFSTVSWERVLSGPGIVHLYSFLRDTGRAEEPAWLRGKLQAENPAAAITEEALKGEAPICVRTLELFTELLGCEAGNLALKVMAVGGVYIAGGIVPRIQARFDRELFMKGFLNKGRLARILESMPIQVVLNEDVGILGAAHFALANSLHSTRGLHEPKRFPRQQQPA